MLLGLNVYRECTGVDTDFVHYTVYTVSAIVGVVISIMAFYNIYATNYSIRNETTFISLIESVVKIIFSSAL